MRYQEILEACWTGYQQQGMKKKGDRQVPNCVPVSEQQMEEDLRKWFKEKWVRFGPDGKIRGSCARGSESEGKPKCLPAAKAHALGKKGRASAAAKKRREDPNAERRGPARNVATRVKEGFEYGNQVQHPKYGAGQVIKVYSNGVITVNFPNYPDPIDKKPGVQPTFGPGDSDYQSLKSIAKEQYTDDDDWYDEEDDRLRDGDYVRDRQDGEYGEIFRMSGDPSERRVRILDRDGRGWYISPERLIAVDRMDPDIMKYFGRRRQRDMDEGINEGLIYSGDTWEDVLYRINVLNDIFGDQKDLAATFEPASQPEWIPLRDRILRSRTVLDTYAKVKQLANMNVPLTDVEIEMLDDVAWDGGGGPVEPAGHWGERDYDWLENLYAQQFAVVQHLLDQRAQGQGQNKTKSGQTVHEQGVAEGWSDAVVARRTGTPRTPYSVYIKGRKWKDFENDDHAEAVANKLRAKFRADGRDPETITIAPTNTLDEKQDACYRKVKSRYKVWPSAYASGALVQCRKKGAANWGTGAKKK